MRRKKQAVTFGARLERIFIDEKLNNWVGYFIFGAIAVLFGYLMGQKAFLGMGLFALVIGVFVIMACLVSPEAGLYINLYYAFFCCYFLRLIDPSFPVGLVTDILISATFLGVFIKGGQLKKLFGQFMQTPVVIMMVLFLLYLLIELFNPNGHSFEGWFQTFRRFLGSMLLMFIAFTVFDSRKRIRRFIVALFVGCVIAGLYACIQQWHGLFQFEKDWVAADKGRLGLYYINGVYRKFSTMPDPTSFGVAMASCAVFFLILAMKLKKASQKYTLIAGSVIMMLGMAYSGTRTANIMIVGGAAIFILLSFNHKATRIFAFFATMTFLFLLYAPIYSNPTLNRFRTSFMASEDGSYKVRDVNRKFIQPYIYSHPIGGGLGTSGAGGLRYAPGHYLAGFPPDSGYLKKAIETGFIGLGLVCILYFIILQYSIKGYFRARSENDKFLFAASIALLFSFYIAEYPQEAIGQITDMVIYYPIIAIMLKLRYLEKKKETVDDPLFRVQD